jgi:hypothetical protein
VKFPKPNFELLRHHFKTDPDSVHICARSFSSGSPSLTETSAMRMGEALLLANLLLQDRQSLSSLAERGDGRLFHYGLFGYEGDLCPHGIPRGGADLSYFLQDHWGKPAVYRQPRAAEPPGEIVDTTGVLSFIGIDRERAQGHVDLWDKKQTAGSDFWGARKVFYWRLD